MSTRRRLVVAIGLVVAMFVIVSIARAVVWFNRNEPETFADIREHFKYGSVGAEDRNGFPLVVWRVLPIVFADLLPEGPGEGFERFGFIFEEGAERPIGSSVRRDPIPLVGLNCAVCHTGTWRESPDGAQHVVLGMPAHEFDLQKYLRFLFAVADDERFTPSVLLPVMKETEPNFSWLDRQLYRYVVIPLIKSEIGRIEDDFAFMDTRPDYGPGRVDTFNPVKVFFDIDLSGDHTIGTADLPSLWLQGARKGMFLHWDGNNNSVQERNINAAIAAGASEQSLDLGSLGRLADWINDLPPPDIPPAWVDWSRVDAGREVYEAHCAECHAFDGAKVGTVTPLTEIGTDPERLRSFTPELRDANNMLGAGRPWAFSHFRVTDGYANMPLDGLWLRAPYLHNGSVPTLRDLLEPPPERPAVFYRGYDVFDSVDVGFVTDGPEAEAEGYRFDTSVAGNGNGGHLYGVDLTPEQKDALLEYLKTE